MRLNRWHNAGIVISILWAFGAAVYTHNADIKAADDFANFSYKVCVQGKQVAHNSDLTSCDQEKVKDRQIWMKGDEGNSAFAALVPIPFGWLACFILLYIWRIQVVGCRSIVGWSALNKWKRVVVAGCAVAVIATVVMSATVLLNMYTDTQVPVAVSPFFDVENYKDTVTVAGTWTRSDATGKSDEADPLQTSHIECVRTQNTCIESLATVSGFGAPPVLAADLVRYDIQSWTNDAIVMRNDGLCTTQVYTIDLNTKSVTGYGQTANADTEYCKVFGGVEDHWSYKMVPGFGVYWSLHQNARPTMLKVIQAFFGN
jgi:hypothetical protein